MIRQQKNQVQNDDKEGIKMFEKIIFTTNENGIQLKFENIDKQNQFLDDMKNEGIVFFEQKNGDCYIKPYEGDGTYGFFKSKQGRVGLLFESEEHKFRFIERAGIADDCYMDMGAGYDTQMHFNEKSLLPEPGHSMEANRFISTLSPAP